ncbi:MAG TPA: hypothetical protein VG167_21780 [Verrucomicrobiae bacterium]|nr:hypothetical protein [Verrucomicrobiae bacterium]
MPFDLSKKLFPDCTRWERRLKLERLVLTITGGLVLAGAIAAFILWSSRVR